MDQLSSINSNTWDWWSVPPKNDITDRPRPTTRHGVSWLWYGMEPLIINGEKYTDNWGYFTPISGVITYLQLVARTWRSRVLCQISVKKHPFCLGAGNVPFIAQYIARTVSWGKCYEKNNRVVSTPRTCIFFPERKSAKGAGNEWVGRLLFFGGRLIFRGEMFVFTECNPHPTKKNTSAMKKYVAKSWTNPYWFYTTWDPTSYRRGYNYIPYKYWGYNPSYLVFGHL